MMYNSLRGGDLILKVVDTDSLSHVSIPDKVLAATYEKHPFDNEAMEFRIMSRNTVKAVSQQDIALLKQYKSICDDVLPGMRARSHLHNIIFRDKDTCTALLVDNNSSINPRIASVVGGSTFRLIRTGSRYTILEILTMVVAPRMKKRGRGLGTRITNALKFLTVQTTRLRRDYGSFILTQADNTTIAINFWKRQLLELNDSAAMVVAALNRIDPKKHHSYESAFPMLGILRATEYVAEDPANSISCTCGQVTHALSLEDRSMRLLRCTFCGSQQHYDCVKDLLHDAEPEAYICTECQKEKPAHPHSAPSPLSSISFASSNLAAHMSPTDLHQHSKQKPAQEGSHNSMRIVDVNHQIVHQCKTSGSVETLPMADKPTCARSIKDSISVTSPSSETGTDDASIITVPSSEKIVGIAAVTDGTTPATNTNLLCNGEHTPKDANSLADILHKAWQNVVLDSKGYYEYASQPSDCAASQAQLNTNTSQRSDAVPSSRPEHWPHSCVEDAHRKPQQPSIPTASASAATFGDLRRVAANYESDTGNDSIATQNYPAHLVWRMHKACDTVTESGAMMDEVEDWLHGSVENRKALLHCNFLGVARRWLAPCRSGSTVPRLALRARLLEVLLELAPLTQLGDVQRSDGIVQLIRWYMHHERESTRNQRRCERLHRAWGQLLHTVVHSPTKLEPKVKEYAKDTVMRAIVAQEYADVKTPAMLSSRVPAPTHTNVHRTAGIPMVMAPRAVEHRPLAALPVAPLVHDRARAHESPTTATSPIPTKRARQSLGQDATPRAMEHRRPACDSHGVSESVVVLPRASAQTMDRISQWVSSTVTRTLPPGTITHDPESAPETVQPREVVSSPATLSKHAKVSLNSKQTIAAYAKEYLKRQSRDLPKETFKILVQSATHDVSALVRKQTPSKYVKIPFNLTSELKEQIKALLDRRMQGL